MQILTASSSIVLVQSSCAIRATALRISLVALSPLSLRVFITIATFTYTGKNVHYKMIILRATDASISGENCKKITVRLWSTCSPSSVIRMLCQEVIS